jgi:hypothetical protein
MQRRLKAPALQINETRGKSVTAFDRQTTPVGRVVQVRLPVGSFTWHRPVAVEIRQGEAIHRLPIHNVTMRVMSAIVLTGLAVAVLISLLMRRVRPREGEEQHDYRGKSESTYD